VSNAAPFLELRDVRVQFGGLTALDGVSLKIEERSVVSLIGPNGAGKTTVFNSISGFVSPQAGEILINGAPSSWPATHRLIEMGISRTLQGVGLFAGISVLENVMLGADQKYQAGFLRDLLGFSGKAERVLRASAMEALERAGALALANKYPHELSYPDTKRVALARALISEPKLLLLDEPAAGLGQSDIDALARTIQEIKKNCAVLLVEHHVDFVGEVSDQVYVLNFGRIIAAGDFETVRKRPEVLAAYLGEEVAGA